MTFANLDRNSTLVDIVGIMLRVGIEFLRWVSLGMLLGRPCVESDSCPRHTSIESRHPWIQMLFASSTVSANVHDPACRVAQGHGERRDGPADNRVRSHKTVLANMNTGKDHGVDGHLAIVVDSPTARVVRRRVRIVGHHNKRIQKDKVTKHAGLRDLNITMQAAIVAHCHIALDIAECSHHAVVADMGVLADASPVTGHESSPPECIRHR